MPPRTALPPRPPSVSALGGPALLPQAVLIAALTVARVAASIWLTPVDAVGAEVSAAGSISPKAETVLASIVGAIGPTVGMAVDAETTTFVEARVTALKTALAPWAADRGYFNFADNTIEGESLYPPDKTPIPPWDAGTLSEAAPGKLNELKLPDGWRP